MLLQGTQSTLPLVLRATEAEEAGAAAGGVNVEFEEGEEEEEEEERKQEAAERKEAGAASQGLQGCGLSQEKDAEDDLPDESSAKKRSSKAKKKKGGDQGGSACKTAPWATEAKEAGAAAAGVGVEAKSWPPPLQTDVEQAASLMSGAAATCEGEKLFMAKFNLSRSDTSSGEAPTAGSSTALGPAAVPEEAPAPAESMSRAVSAVLGVGLRYSYHSLSKATNNFEKRLGGGECGSVFQGVLAAGTRVAVKRLELDGLPGAGGGCLSMADQMRTEVEVLSQVHHVNIVQLMGWSKDGMAPCLVYAFMEGGSLQDRLACRGRCVSFTVTSRAQTCCWTEIVMAVLATSASLNP